jgi:3-phenylpropionate/trans-cinnamate dioxygenase ferredoxin reductase subunit
MVVESAVRSVLIVGACQAGVQVAASLRDYGYQGAITLVSAETHPPYQRPPLSKALLKGEISADALVLRSAEFYDDQGIELVLGERVISVTRAGEGGAGLGRTDAGRLIDFDRLALTVGSRPRRLVVPGADLDGVLYLRDIDDAVSLRGRLSRADRIVVVGGGFIGLEVAASARLMGKDVRVVLPAERLMARAVGETSAEIFRAEHEARGVDVRTQTSVTEVLGDHGGAVRGVRTSDGDELAADLVIVGIGADPRVELAEQFGLAVENGIIVDEHAVASDGFTVAAGDCANMPNPLSHGRGASRMRLESLNNATEQAKVAAASLIGEKTPYKTIPWFWSDQYDLKLQVAGVADGFDHVVVRGVVEDRRFSVLYYAGREVVAVECVNNPADFAIIRGAMLRGHTIPEQVAADPTFSLRGTAVPVEPELLETA